MNYKDLGSNSKVMQCGSFLPVWEKKKEIRGGKICWSGRQYNGLKPSNFCTGHNGLVDTKYFLPESHELFYKNNQRVKYDYSKLYCFSNKQFYFMK